MKENNILKQLNSTVILLTSIVALVAGVWSFVTSMNNKEEIAAIIKAEKIKESFITHKPCNGCKISNPTFEVSGVLGTNLSYIENSKLWLVTYDKNGYILLYDNVTITATKKWFHHTAFYQTPNNKNGKFKLMLVLTDKKGTKWFENNLEAKATAHKTLPDELIVIDFIELERIYN